LQRIRLAAAIFWTLTIMALCWLPPPWVHEVQRSSSWFEIPNLDKVVHWGIFCAFAVLWLRVLGSRRRYWLVALAGLALAAITELVQNLPIVNRDGNMGDAITDLIGVLIGLTIASWVEPLLRLVETRLFGKMVS
jgi:hypothetical protein